MNEFRVSFVRIGVTYPPKYARTVQAAVKVARSLGFSRRQLHHDTRPDYATIQHRVSGEGHNVWWETVAKITKDNIVTADYASRESVIRKQRQIAELQVGINDAESIQIRLCRIADEEYATSSLASAGHSPAEHPEV